jgi:uncharacterized protein YaiL (DUF2058 family)
MYPSAADAEKRRFYQSQLERQQKTDQLERERNATRDTPEARAERQRTALAHKEFIEMSKLAQKDRYLQFKNTWETGKLAQHALDTLERSGNAGMVEILKNFHIELMILMP